MHYWKILNKVKLFLCTPGRNMKQWMYSFIPSSHQVVSGCFTLMESASVSTEQEAGWVDDSEKRKISCPCQKLNHNSCYPVCSLVVISTTPSRLSDQIITCNYWFWQDTETFLHLSSLSLSNCIHSSATNWACHNCKRTPPSDLEQSTTQGRYQHNTQTFKCVKQCKKNIRTTSLLWET
jgi:hypothetical protein